ncbi:phosphoribosyltransferase family protein [uncultured Helicobacter sp.]|uniref:phosphoribosyltransferase n=1 Tax=uncultured Helicobacter sp. TaxID=175537 RepID=UPI001FA5F6DD|nr:phosphoribosyltransferase family protein [uncultured Helicobacter sp.]HIY44048.1 phosphoribosyltransferase [Candidatus Helicobacter avistercoris]
MDKKKNCFLNQQDAAQRLIKELENVNFYNTMILSISTDAQSLAQSVATHFDLPLEHLFLDPISAPENPECIIAVVSELMDVVIDENLLQSFGIDIDYVYQKAQENYEKNIIPLARRIRKGEKISSFENKNILIIDESVETGFSIEVAIKTCVNHGCKSASVATPVLSRDVESYLLKICDCVYKVISPDFFVSTNYYYKELQTQRKDLLLRESYLV